MCFFLVLAGKDYISQIRLIVGMVGSPKDDLLQLCHSPIIKNYFRGRLTLISLSTCSFFMLCLSSAVVVVFKSNFFRKFFRNTIRVSNSLDPDQIGFRSYLDPNCLQRFKQTLKLATSTCLPISFPSLHIPICFLFLRTKFRNKQCYSIRFSLNFWTLISFLTP